MWECLGKAALSCLSWLTREDLNQSQSISPGCWVENRIGEEGLAAIQSAINKNPLVNVNKLRYTDITCFERLKESEIEKIKAYACVVYTNRQISQEEIDKLSSIRDLPVQQKTPLRVLHRRTLMVREKVIHRVRAVKINEHFMIVAVLSSAGTYIKEFIHGNSISLPSQRE